MNMEESITSADKARLDNSCPYTPTLRLLKQILADFAFKLHPRLVRLRSQMCETYWAPIGEYLFSMK